MRCPEGHLRCSMSVAKYKRQLVFAFMVACSVFLLTAYYRHSSLRVLSTAFQPQSKPKYNMSTSSIGLSTWLQANKASFLADVKFDGAKKWTIVMGNEAGGETLLSFIMFLALIS